jgi:hypothetical protein
VLGSVSPCVLDWSQPCIRAPVRLASLLACSKLTYAVLADVIERNQMFWSAKLLFRGGKIQAKTHQ